MLKREQYMNCSTVFREVERFEKEMKKDRIIQETAEKTTKELEKD